MLTIRIIPCLDIKDGRVVKGIKFKDLKDAGEPSELAKLYNDEGADEITFLDVDASYMSREIIIEVVEKVAKEVFIPLTVGGGIRALEDIRRVLNVGADKVAICTAAIRNPQLISDAAELFGSQCIVLSIDAKRCGASWHAYMKGGREDSKLDAIEWAKEGERRGAGEILLNSIDMDGTKEGYELELIKKVSETVNIPVIASGGAGNLEQMLKAVMVGKSDALLLASLLHYREYTIADIKKYLQERGVSVRW